MKKHDLIDFLALAAERGASDLHLTVGAPPMLRVAGVIQPLTEGATVGGGHKEIGDRYFEGGTTGEAGKRMAA